MESYAASGASSISNPSRVHRSQKSQNASSQACRFGNGHEVDLRTRLPTDAEINELVAKIVHWRFISAGSLDGRLAPPFDACARALGNVSRAAQISADGSGAALFAEVQTVGALSVRAFCEWWLAMDFADRVHDFMENNFDQCIPLVEQSSQRLFR